jgi:hypothetical protein
LPRIVLGYIDIGAVELQPGAIGIAGYGWWRRMRAA